VYLFRYSNFFKFNEFPRTNGLSITLGCI